LAGKGSGGMFFGHDNNTSVSVRCEQGLALAVKKLMRERTSSTSVQRAFSVERYTGE